MLGWYVEVPDLVVFAYINKSSFPLVFYEYLHLLLCGFDGFYIIASILVICLL